MGLFSRTNTGANGQEDFDEIDLPTSDDLKGGLFTSDEAKITPVAAPTKPSTPVRRNYSIEDAIKLMKSLPRDSNEVVVTVVKKTLESTNIRVQDIVEDANQKEARIRSQHKSLEGEIKELQDQIAKRNQQISDLLHDLKETTDVRQRLQLAMELEGEKTAAAKAQAAPAPEKNRTEAESAPAQQTPAQSATPNRPQATAGGNSTPEENMRRRAQQRSNPH